MPDISTNLGLNLPKGSDTFDYDVFLHQNFQKIDDKAASTDASLAEKASFKDENVSSLYIAPFFRSNSDTSVDLYASNDGVNFNLVSNMPLFSERDSAIIYRDGYFYVCCTQSVTTPPYEFKIKRSKNLKDWETFNINLGLVNSTYPACWAPEWFEDDNGKLYVTFSLQVGANNDMRPYIVEVTNLLNLQFGTPTLINIENRNWIDNFIFKNNGTYYLFIKKETEAVISIFTSPDLVSWTKQVDSISSLAGVEAPSVLKIGSTFYLYVDNPGGQNGANMQYCTSTDLLTWSAPKRLITEQTTRHGSVYQVKNRDAKTILNDFMSTNTLNKKLSKSFNYVNLESLASGGVISNLNMVNNTVYCIFSQNITINATSFQDDGTVTPYKVYFAIFAAPNSSGSITIKNNNGKIYNPLQQDFIMTPANHSNAILEFSRPYASSNAEGLRLSSVDIPTINNAIKTNLSTFTRVDLSTLATAGAVSNLAVADNTLYYTGNNITVNSVTLSNLTNGRGRCYFMSYGAATITFKNGSANNIYMPNSTDFVISAANGNNESYVEFVNDLGGLRKVR
jgi:hypothetical protein